MSNLKVNDISRYYWSLVSFLSFFSFFNFSPLIFLLNFVSMGITSIILNSCANFLNVFILYYFIKFLLFYHVRIPKNSLCNRHWENVNKATKTLRKCCRQDTCLWSYHGPMGHPRDSDIQEKASNI
jgi:hypothetical protein